MFPLALFRIPRASRAGARAQLTAPTCARWRDARVRRRSACTEARHLFSLPADEGTRSEGGFRLTRTTPRGAPRLARRRILFARRERARRAASRDHGGRAEGEQGPDAGEGASRAPRGRGRGRRAARDPGRWGPTRFFRAERAERRSRSPPTDANDAGERRKGPREGAREGARAARERREARGTPSATNPSRGRVASRTASRPRIRAAPGKIAPTAPDLSAHRARRPPLLFHRAFPPIRFFAPSVRRTLTTLAPNPRPRVASLHPPPSSSPPPLREGSGSEPSLDARARCQPANPPPPDATPDAPPPQTNTADRARPPRDRRRRSSPLPALVHATDAIVLGTGAGTPGTPGPRGPRSPPTPGGPAPGGPPAAAKAAAPRGGARGARAAFPRQVGAAAATRAIEHLAGARGSLSSSLSELTDHHHHHAPRRGRAPGSLLRPGRRPRAERGAPGSHAHVQMSPGGGYGPRPRRALELRARGVPRGRRGARGVQGFSERGRERRRPARARERGDEGGGDGDAFAARGGSAVRRRAIISVVMVPIRVPRILRVPIRVRRILRVLIRVRILRVRVLTASAAVRLRPPRVRARALAA